MTLAEPPARALKLRTANPLYGSFCSLCVLYAHESISVKKGSGTMPELVPYGDNFTLVLPMEDDLLHTADQPFCFDPTCPCHTNDDLRHAFATQVYDYILDGTLTVSEAERLLEGRTV